jgi:predicted methyltransferase MtxX (methanogen marker protein 4)
LQPCERLRKRKAKKIGRNKPTAVEAAKQIEAKLVLYDVGLLEKEEPRTLFREYASTWLDGYVKTALKSSTYPSFIRYDTDSCRS